jgi:hypothetical protein
MRNLALWALWAIALLPGCDPEGASMDQCQAIFERLVTIELEEMGFRDPALAALTREQLSKRHQAEIATCVGRRLSANAMSCVTTAHDAEAVSHECLR